MTVRAFASGRVINGNAIVEPVENWWYYNPEGEKVYGPFSEPVARLVESMALPGYYIKQEIL